MRALVVAPFGAVVPACRNVPWWSLSAEGSHYHRGASFSRSANSEMRRRSFGGPAYYRNGSEAQAAGAAPVRRGDPGYAPRLDRDIDGSDANKWLE